MKICIFSRSLPVHRMGGMELHTEIIMKGLADRGHGVTVITTKHPEKCLSENRGNIRIDYLPQTWAGQYYLGYWKRSRVHFEKMQEIETCDIVLSESAGAYGILKQRRKIKEVPVVLFIHGTSLGEYRSKMKLGFPMPKNLLGSMINLWSHFRDRRLLCKADLIIGGSDSVKDALVQELHINPSNIQIIYNSIDTTLFSPNTLSGEKIRDQLGVAPGQFVILCAGRLIKEKGIHLLLQSLSDILSLIPETRLVILGEGSYEKSLKRLAKKLGIDKPVQFIGHVDYQALPAYYNAADVLVMPTIRYEGLPLTLLEAMGCGVPVIASNLGGIGDVLKHDEEGLLFQMDDCKMMVDHIVYLHRHKDLLKKMGMQARQKIIQNHSLDTMINKLESAFQKTMDRGV